MAHFPIKLEAKTIRTWQKKEPSKSMLRKFEEKKDYPN